MKSKERLSNFELMRIVSMFMIVSCHLITHGVQQTLLESAFEVYRRGTFGNRIFASLLIPGGGIGVALFFMLTGYFQINTLRPRIKKVVLQSVFYGWFTLAFFVIVKVFGGVKDLGGFSDIKALLLNALAPSSNGIWWFVTAYVMVMLMSPCINVLIKSLNRKGLTFVLFSAWYSLMLIGGCSGTAFNTIYRGMFYYLMGAYVRILSKKREEKGNFIYFLFAGLTWTICAVLVFELNEKGRYARIINLMIYAVICPLCALFIFKAFELLRMKQSIMINKIASTTFGVYLIHDSFVARNFIWRDLFKIDTIVYHSALFPVYTLLIVCTIFFGCSVLDFFRMRFMEPIMMRKVTDLERWGMNNSYSEVQGNHTDSEIYQ